MGAPLLVTRELTGAELRDLRRDRDAGRARGAVVSAPPPPSDPEPLPEFKPVAPDVVYRRMMDHLQKWARASKKDWMISLELFRKHNGTAVAHMTDEQLMLMLQDKIETSIRDAYGRMGRDKELQIKTGGW